MDRFLKYIYSFVSLTLFLLTGCVKDNNLSMDFKFTGVKNITIPRGESFELPIRIFYLGGDKENVVVNVENLPQGISLSYSKKSGEPDFNLSIFFHVDTNHANDTSTIQIIGVTDSGVKVMKSMKISVTDPPNHFPNITLLGATNIYLVLNSPWNDPGFTAFDAEDGDLTNQVIVTGTVNNNFSSLYTITYQVTDSKGDKTTVTRKINVFNSLQSLAGNYRCTTIVQGGSTYIWNTQTTIGPSPYKNNFLVLSRISQCYGVSLDLEVNGSILNLPAQYQLGYNSSLPISGICDSLIHFFSGSGSIANLNTFPIITLNYSDLYKDSTGLSSSFYKTDIYSKF